ncbi:putative GPI inositol-deacylase C [Cucumis melo var. makuwa]|uniref:Putative GPI inositol-deacylase C n=1 Tax=Cucumis melo var. makuwa TaxID=1194695 RepID=A0A5D3BEV8_CUCMM|nr:putative GPI inositol-deacylase C [Cucumis melo var. makuwa]
MDIVAGLLGIEADIAQNKVKHLRLWIFECRDPSEQAFKLGLGAAGLLGLAHIIANLLGGSMGNNKSRASCGFTHHHFLSIGGILCFVHGLFCVAYYVTATAAE